MKKMVSLFLFLHCFSIVHAQGNTDPMMAWVSYGSTTWGTVLGFELYAKKSSWGMGQQFFAANVKNGVPYKLRIQGEFYAKLICGNESVSKLDFTIDSYGKLIKADMGSMNVNYLSDATGLLSSADREECTGNEIFAGGKKVGVTRIQALGIRNLKVEAEMGKGGDWVTIRSNGTFVEPTASKSATANSNGTSKQGAVNRTDVQSANSGNPQKSTQTSNAKTSTQNNSRSKAPTSNTNRAVPSDPSAAQRNALQSLASSDLQRAQQATQSPIVQQMHLSNAMITAQASGDAATIRQVQQMQSQVSAQRQQQLTESYTALAGSMVNLYTVIQNQKREKEAAMQRSMDEYNKRKNREALKVAEIEENTAADKMKTLQFIQEEMNKEADSYGVATTAADKLSFALSWLWKNTEAGKILSSKPQVEASYSSDYVKVISEGYLKPSALSLLNARELITKLDIGNLKEAGIVSKENPKLLYPINVPSKARKNFNRKLKFMSPGYSSKISEWDQIEKRYISLDDMLSRNKSFDKLVSGYSHWEFRDVYNYAKNYPADSATCVRDGQKQYRYWKGKSSRSIYAAGFVTQKKMEVKLLHAGLYLDSAIVFTHPDALIRSTDIYSEAFEWYFSGPARWLKIETQPTMLIREAMWKYSLAVAAIRKNLSTSSNLKDPHATLTETFVKHFEQYCQLPISMAIVPLKLN